LLGAREVLVPLHYERGRAMIETVRESEARAFLRVMDALRGYMDSQRDEITSQVGMYPFGEEEGAKYWAQVLGSDLEAYVLAVFEEWEAES
jgi:hypothetical protein